MSPGDRSTAERIDVNCTICGKPTRPGATLCVPCRKALKRARYESVLDLSPLNGKSAPPRPSAQALPSLEALPAAVTPRAILGARTTKLWTAIGLFVVGAGLVTMLLLDGGSGAHPVAKASAGTNAGDFSRAASEPSSVSARLAANPAAVAAPSTVAATGRSPETAAQPSRSASIGAASATDATRATAAGRAEPARTAMKSAPAISAVAEENTPIDAFGPIAQAPKKVDPPPVAAPPAPVDRWQLLAQAIARCDGDFFARVGCEQRARVQYCENYWGVVPQCPQASLTEHGQ